MYIREYLPQIATNINVPLFWDANSTNKFEREVLSKKGRWRKVKDSLIRYGYIEVLYDFIDALCVGY